MPMLLRPQQESMSASDRLLILLVAWLVFLMLWVVVM